MRECRAIGELLRPHNISNDINDISNGNISNGHGGLSLTNGHSGLTRHPGLKTLTLRPFEPGQFSDPSRRSASISADGMKEICRGMGGNHDDANGLSGFECQLVKLDLAETLLGKSDEAVAILAKALPNMRHLRELDVSRCAIGDKGMQKIIEGLMGNVNVIESSSSSLSSSSSNPLTIGSEPGSFKPPLRHLNVGCNRLTLPGFKAVCNFLEQSSTLQSLTLSASYDVQESVARECSEALADALKACKSNSLEQLTYLSSHKENKNPWMQLLCLRAIRRSLGLKNLKVVMWRTKMVSAEERQNLEAQNGKTVQDGTQKDVVGEGEPKTEEEQLEQWIQSERGTVRENLKLLRERIARQEEVGESGRGEKAEKQETDSITAPASQARLNASASQARLTTSDEYLQYLAADAPSFRSGLWERVHERSQQEELAELRRFQVFLNNRHVGVH
jgi:hypothetical protein